MGPTAVTLFTGMAEANSVACTWMGSGALSPSIMKATFTSMATTARMPVAATRTWRRRLSRFFRRALAGTTTFAGSLP